MDHAHFSHAKGNEPRFLAVEKSLHKTEDNTHSKMKKTLEFKMIKLKESLSFDQHMNVPEKWLMGVTNLQL